MVAEQLTDCILPEFGCSYIGPSNRVNFKMSSIFPLIFSLKIEITWEIWFFNVGILLQALAAKGPTVLNFVQTLESYNYSVENFNLNDSWGVGKLLMWLIILKSFITKHFLAW